MIKYAMASGAMFRRTRAAALNSRPAKPGPPPPTDKLPVNALRARPAWMLFTGFRRV